MGQDITVTTKDGSTIGAYRAEPETGVAPIGSVVVIQEIFGVNTHIREVTDGYAVQGYVAIAPKIFDRIDSNIELGYTDADMAKGIELAFQKLNLEQALVDIQATIDVGWQARQGGRCWVLFWRAINLALQLVDFPVFMRLQATMAVVSSAISTCKLSAPQSCTLVS